jgi:predicted histone-like DNA-binding protein
LYLIGIFALVHASQRRDSEGWLPNLFILLFFEKMIVLNKIQRPNPLDKDAPKKFYVSASSTGSVDLEEMSVNISERCTITEPDVLAVLSALTSEMTKQLMDGKIVRFGSFGSFQLGVLSHGAATEEETSRNLVKGVRVKFRPGRRISDALAALRFTLKTV